MAVDFRSKIVQISNWPNPGITCYETAAILRDPGLFGALVEALADAYKDKKIDAVAGIEARGFLLAGALAARLGAGAIMIRKRGKLPPPTMFQEYSYEYAATAIEMNPELAQPGSQVVIVDDVVATGGTMVAAAKLLERAGAAVVGISCIVLVDFMAARGRLKGKEVHAVVTYT